MAAPGWGSRPGAGGREGAGSRARPAAARKSARGTGRWSRGSRGGGEPRAPASKTRGRKREKRRGGAGGDRGFCPRRAFRKLPGPRASPAEVPARPAPQPGGVCRIISPSPASLSEPRPPPLPGRAGGAGGRRRELPGAGSTDRCLSVPRSRGGAWGEAIATPGPRHTHSSPAFQFRPPSEGASRGNRAFVVGTRSTTESPVPAASEGGGAQFAAAHPDIHPRKVHPTAAAFPLFLLFKERAKEQGATSPQPAGLPATSRGGPEKTLPSGQPLGGQRAPAEQPRGLGSPPAAARPRAAAGLAAPAAGSGRPSPRRRACPAGRGRPHPRESPPVHPTRERSPTAGPCRQRRDIPPAPTRASCRGQRLLAFRRPLRRLLTEGF